MELKLVIDKDNGFDLVFQDTRLNATDKLTFCDIVLRAPNYVLNIKLNGAKPDAGIDELIQVSPVRIKRSLINLFKYGYLQVADNSIAGEEKSELVIVTNPRLLGAGSNDVKNSRKKNVLTIRGKAKDGHQGKIASDPFSLLPFLPPHTPPSYSFSLNPVNSASLFLEKKLDAVPRKIAGDDGSSDDVAEEETITVHRRADRRVIENIRKMEVAVLGAEFIFRYWNSIGKPFIVHKRGTKKEARIYRLLNLALRSCRSDEIIEAVESFYGFITSKEAGINTRQPGFNSIGLDDFFQFSSRLREAIDRRNKRLSGLKGWFMEARKGRAYLIETYGTRTPDKLPTVTKALMMFWAEQVNRGDSFSLQQINHFRKAAVLTKEFLEEHRARLIMSHRELNYPAQFARYVIGCYVDIARRKPTANTSYITHDWFYEEAMVLYLTNRGYYGNEKNGHRNRRP